MDGALSQIKLCLNFYPTTVNSRKFTQELGNKNNSTVFHAPRGKHVLINMSPTEAVLITNTGKVYAGISQNTCISPTEGKRQTKWLVKSKLLEANTGAQEIEGASKRSKPQVGFFTLSIPPGEESLSKQRLPEKSNPTKLSELHESVTYEPLEDTNMRQLKLNDDHVLPPFGCNNAIGNTQSEKHLETTGTEVITKKLKTVKPIQKCDECEKVFPRRDILKLHIKETGHFLARCKICGEGFKLRTSLETHYVKHTGKQPGFVCNICEKSFYSSKSFKAHKLTHLGPKVHKCSNCDKAFQTRRHLVNHEYIHKPYSERPFGCTYCDNRFVDATSLKYHINHHEGQYNFLCDLCAIAFVSNAKLQRHKRADHDVQSGKEIKKKKTIIRKNKNNAMPKDGVRTGDAIYRFSCKICGKLHKRLGDLREHIQRHVGDKPFQCRFCELRFVKSIEREHHEKVHKNDRKFVCDICGNKYCLLKNLLNHSVVHKEKSFKCSICNKMFRHKASYTSHLDLHLGKKLFECTVCKENMLRNTNFRSREAVKMSCDFCGEKLKLVRSRTKTIKFIEAKKNV